MVARGVRPRRARGDRERVSALSFSCPLSRIRFTDNELEKTRGRQRWHLLLGGLGSRIKKRRVSARNRGVRTSPGNNAVPACTRRN